MKLLAFAASLRRESLNRKLILVAARTARELGATIDLRDFAEFDMPIYNGDVQEQQGFPKGAEALKRAVEAADGIVISTPEYNYSIPGTLKNAIDWLSRYRPMPTWGKSALLLSASPSLAGGNRGLWQTRIPLECVGVFVHPEMFGLAKADEAFDPEGQLTNPKMRDTLTELMRDYLSAATALSQRH